MNLTKRALLLMSVLVASGCTNAMFQEELIKQHKKCWSHMAWHLEKPRFKADGNVRPWLDDFGRGWRAGYYDKAMGGSGRIPMLPPTRYWGVMHQNPTGREEIQAWFAGYQQGATAAEGDAVGQWMPIPESGGEQAGIEDKRRRLHPTAEPIPTGPPIDQEPMPPEDLPEKKPAAPNTEELPPAKTNKVTSILSSRRIPLFAETSKQEQPAQAVEPAQAVADMQNEQPKPEQSPAKKPKKVSRESVRLGIQ